MAPSALICYDYFNYSYTIYIFTEQGSVIESPEPTACTFGTFGVIDLAHFLRCDWLTQEMPCYAVSERLLYT